MYGWTPFSGIKLLQNFGTTKVALILYHFLHKKIFLIVTATQKKISKTMKLTNVYYQYLKTVGFSGKQGNVTLIHPMSFKPKIYANAVLQCLVDKYVITYENIWDEGMVRSQLVESSYCKILVLLKVMLGLNHFLHKKMFVDSCCYTKKNFKNTKLTNIYNKKGQSMG